MCDLKHKTVQLITIREAPLYGEGFVALLIQITLQLLG